MNLFFPTPRTIKPKTRAQSNPEQCKISYKIPILHRNLQDMKNSSNPNQHEKTNLEKSLNLQPRTLSNNTPPINNTKSTINNTKSAVNKPKSTRSTQSKPSSSHSQLNNTKMMSRSVEMEIITFHRRVRRSRWSSDFNLVEVQPTLTTYLHPNHQSPPPIQTTPRKTRKTQRLESQVQRERKGLKA